jgi:hypothetical protein
MKITIVPADGFVSVDGRGFSGLTFEVPANVHAMVWKDTEGDAQMVDETGAIVANLVVESLLDYQGAVDAWEAARALADAPVEPPVPGVPQIVSMRQARLALLGAGMLGAVTEAINNLPEPDRSVATIEWEYSQEVHRNRTLIHALGPMLGLSDAQLDGLFTVAATL